MNEEGALFELQNEYNFVFEHFEAPSAITRVLAPLDFSEVGMGKGVRRRDLFYFEVHVDEEGEPLAYFPSGWRIPREVAERLRDPKVGFLGRLRRMFGFDRLTRVMTFQYSRETGFSSAEQVRSVLDIVGLKRRSVGTKMEETSDEPVENKAPPSARKAGSSKKFTIKNIEGEVKERAIGELNHEELQRISTHHLHDLCTGQIIFSGRAWKEIANHIGFGMRTKTNVVEQGGVYVGTPCICSNGQRVGLVKTAIAAPNTSGTSTYVEFGHEVWKHFMHELEVLKAHGGCDQDDAILGWYHTHPNGLDVFMSGTDMGTQREQFYRHWNSAVVINPHRKLIAGFYGGQASPAEVLLHQGN